MGVQKLLLPFGDRTVIEHVIDAAARWRPVVVAGPEVSRALAHTGVTVVLNDKPERGMSYSLKLADSVVPRGATLIVCLGDMPLLDPSLIALLDARMGRADIAYPIGTQTRAPGHPVFVSAAARRLICDLPDGDTVRTLRDDSRLTRRAVPTDRRGAFFDVDTPRQVVEGALRCSSNLSA